VPTGTQEPRQVSQGFAGVVWVDQCDQEPRAPVVFISRRTVEVSMVTSLALMRLVG